MNDTTLSPYGRGTCPVCKRDFNLTKRGVMRVHVDYRAGHQGYGRPRCKGNGQEPTEVTA